MVARGYVHNGVVVLADGVHLSEGQEVMVLVSSEAESRAHSIMDIPPVSVGAILKPLRTDDDDLLGEMLEGRA